MTRQNSSCLVLGAVMLIFNLAVAQAETIAPPYDANYSISDLGSLPPSVPTPYGGLTIRASDPNTLLIGGNAESPGAGIYSLGVIRNAQNHIDHFSGPASLLASAPGLGGGGIDGGLQYGPGGVLFYTTYGDNTLGQIKPGSTAPDKLIDLTGAGVADSTGSLAFVPAGFTGAGKLVLLSYNPSAWYSTTLTPDGNGTYNLGAVVQGAVLNPENEGILYVPAGSPHFPNPTVLIVGFESGNVQAYDLDASGAPVLASARDFITGVSAPMGATLDPLTGDFLFSTWHHGDHIFLVTAPEPSSWLLLGLGAAVSLLGFAFRRRKRAAQVC